MTNVSILDVHHEVRRHVRDLDDDRCKRAPK